ncbi:hypothetical protein WBJ53_06335 [Spirosoma sp. SC4-14]|uniref:hypothetical protein n=1 Tax=Spirosoma sp. SC4-14 TaxID=3128900 RepID=UPI0030D5E39D
MGTNILEERMLEDTLGAFRNDSDGGISQAQGVMLIDGWLQALEGDPNLDQIKGQLNELRDELQAPQPDHRHVRELMLSLADKTQEIAEEPVSEGVWTGGLESLSKILRSFGGKL